LHIVIYQIHKTQMTNYKIIIFFLFLPSFIFAQIGGNQTYKFLELTNSARAASLGGSIISIKEADLALTYHNPALLCDTMLNNLVLNYVNYFADINYGYLAYARNYKKIGNLSIGLHYINYGNFLETNELGEKLGEFKAAEYAFNFIWANKLNNFISYGVNFKPIVSNLEHYTSIGVAIDAGILYENEKHLTNIAFVIKNFGTQLTSYTENNREKLPLELQLGVTKALEHAPFRISIVYRHIENWNLRFDSPSEATTTNIFNEKPKEKTEISKFSDNLMRHLVYGIEFIPFKSFYFNFSYNHQRRMELSLQQIGGTTGFSWGFGLNLARFNLAYGRAAYHVAGASNHFSFSTRIKK